MLTGTAEWDHGCACWSRPVDWDYDTARQLHERLTIAGPPSLALTLAQWADGERILLQITPTLGVGEGLVWRLKLDTREGWPIVDLRGPALDPLMSEAVTTVGRLGGLRAAVEAANAMLD